MSHITIIDDFLPWPEFRGLRNIFYNDKKFSWVHNRSVAYETDKNSNWNWYGTHMFYENHKPVSKYYDFLGPLLDLMHLKCGLHALYRIKANFYPWTETLKEHPWHIDYNFPHKGALLSMNTCDGYTAFEDGTKVESVENRMLLFDPRVKHHSTTTTDAKGRYNINFNYL